MRVMRAVMLVLALAMAMPFAAAPATAEAADCEFILGFKAIHDMIPDRVGECLSNEFHGANGDGLQVTRAWHGKGGLLVWRKADNWTAFTDGADSWVNGPYGLQKRANGVRFCAWEANPENLPCVGATATPGVNPTPKPTVQPPPVVSTPGRWHEDAEKKFWYPDGWIPGRGCAGRCYGYIEPNGRAMIVYYAPLRMGPDYKLEELFYKWKANNNSLKGLTMGGLEQLTVNGFPAAIQYYEYTNDQGFREKGYIFGIKNGALIYEVDFFGVASRWGEYEPLFRQSIRSFIPKSGG